MSAAGLPNEDQPGHGVLLHTTRGDIHTIVHSNPDPDYRTDKAIVFVWGARGGFDGPAGGIYARLAEDLKYIATSIRIDYRLPNVIPECVLDTMAGLVLSQRHRPHRCHSRRALIRWRGCHSRRAIQLHSESGCCPVLADIRRIQRRSHIPQAAASGAWRL